MLLGVITLFPDMFQSIVRYGIVGRAIRRGILSIKLWNPRLFTYDRHHSVDARPYGGGPGMLMMIEPLRNAINQAKDELGNNIKVIYLSPQGRKLKQKYVYKLAYDHQKLILVCGRYQGIDERLIQTEIDEEWSIGDYILSGGELAAMVLIDTISRVLPGVLGNQDSKESDSFSKERLDCPHYTRPETFDGMKVPSVLLSGNHDEIHRWKQKQALGRTWIKRPDLLNYIQLTNEEKNLLSEFKNEYLLSLNKKTRK
ncbi:tRNA(guanine-N1)methyltransferase [Candidatus Blochmanniella pennsylvanica str. BPEN]|uniref:tRNA (guanine-N(1)-)-methyltransferase n=1 Tax=Blochmanniella pennsylvanica (strain BPEN) TaxID=291272 RepID=TRMD_BLOPB|nr:tRNA (guanosine(37)-N1)-methyltransferase TrmD [Candidatus Blochmannia pennsylvanicus]Q493M1.1 RecName: Full=tRNA (guanine-N(1)-)-methyltransferase; AltName: Full=M1G-methyltransferase; AltName: Full=tRNA [GM37] methyltransferase [Candidatus Blochmannia pennsylvanicus str. BPEN]AAZ40819.1 tRNA(guanine-N1)methyltransferase [Candidatus Blochmannia pennsylvanicus str. BPEN]